MTAQKENIPGGSTAYTSPLTAVNLSGRLNQVDREILTKDRAMVDVFIESILDNKRLAALLVYAWLDRYGFNLVPRDLTERQ